MDETLATLIVVLMLFLPFAILFKIVKDLLIYYRLQRREKDMAVLAKEFGLSFQSNLPSRLKMAMHFYTKDFEFFKLEGNINNHKILIADKYYGGIYYYLLNQGNRRTLIKVDDVQIPNMPLLGFNELVFAPISALRDYLNKLKSGM